MTPRRLKVDATKRQCDRCKRHAAPIAECSFSFREPLAYWRQLYERQTGNRLTRLRQQALGAEWEFDWKSPPSYWMDLCEACWEECSRPFDDFPMRFYERVLLLPADRAPNQPAISPRAVKSVPTKTVSRPVAPPRGRQAALTL